MQPNAQAGFLASGGIISSAILFIGSVILQKFILPQINGMLQKTPDISGAWEYYDTDTSDSLPIGHVEIVQRGTSVRTTLVRTKGRSGNPMNRVFKASGSFQSAQIVMTFEDSKGTGYIVGAIVLKLFSNLNKLSGKTTFLHHDEGQVIANDIYLKKITR